MKVPFLLLAMIAAGPPVRLHGDEIDDALVRLGNGPPGIHEALTQLHASSDARLVEPLWKLLLGKDEGISISDETVLGHHMIAFKPQARVILARCGKEVAALAVRNLSSANSAARREAAEVLAIYPLPVAEALAPLKTLLRDDSREVRRAAIRGLGGQGAPAIQPLVAHLKKVAAEPDVDEVSAVSDSLIRFHADARTVLPLLTPFLDAAKYPAIVIYEVLRAVERLGYARRDTPEENWDLVLPALERLKRQAKNGDREVPTLGRSLAESIPERIAFRRKAMKASAK